MSFLTDEIMNGANWKALERGIARLMSHGGWQDVKVVGGRGDKGADIIGVRYEKGSPRTFVVQVKAVSGSRYIDATPVQEALDAMYTYDADVAVVATNGEYRKSTYKKRDQLRSEGFDIRLWNGLFLTGLLQNLPEEHHSKKVLRPYQAKIVKSTLSDLDKKVSRMHFIVATGLGKTAIAAELVSQLHEKGFKRALVLCHAQDLALQLEQGFWSQLGKSVPTSVFFDGQFPTPIDGVNFGLYQTFVNRLNGIYPHDYDIVVVDEAHHALAHGFRKCLDHLKPQLLIGMTATPWRSDGQRLDSIFGKLVDTVSLIDGMKMGYLARADYHIYCDTIDWDTVVSDSGNDISVGRLNRQLFVPQRDEVVVEEVVERCKTIKNPRLILFCASIEHCKRIADLLTFASNGQIVCERLSGLNKVDRNAKLMQFASGRIQAVTAVDVLNEGIDVPDVNVLVFLRNTHSRRIFIQQLGRGLRISQNKDQVLVMDFVTDIRRVADVMQMDQEARTRISNKFSDIYFDDGIVTIENQAIVKFVDQWIQDVAELGDADENQILQFPNIL